MRSGARCRPAAKKLLAVLPALREQLVPVFRIYSAVHRVFVVTATPGAKANVNANANVTENLNGKLLMNIEVQPVQPNARSPAAAADCPVFRIAKGETNKFVMLVNLPGRKHCSRAGAVDL